VVKRVTKRRLQQGGNTTWFMKATSENNINKEERKGQAERAGLDND
jgi:hypothetical protein